MKEETKGLYLAVVLSAVAILAVNYIWPKPKANQEIAPEIVVEQEKTANQATKPEVVAISTDEALAKDSRITFENNKVHGSIRVKGARFDSLYLNDYKQTLDENSPDIELLSPSGTAKPYYAEFGWLSDDKDIKLPNNDTNWKLIGKSFLPNRQ